MVTRCFNKLVKLRVMRSGIRSDIRFGIPQDILKQGYIGSFESTVFFIVFESENHLKHIFYSHITQTFALNSKASLFFIFVSHFKISSLIHQFLKMKFNL